MNPQIYAYVIAPTIALLGVLFTGWRMSNSAVKAARAVAQPEEEKSALGGYHQLVLDIQTSMAQLRADHEDLKRHVTRLESQASRDKTLIHWLFVYIKTLRDVITGLGGHVPSAPFDIEAHIEGSGVIPDILPE